MLNEQLLFLATENGKQGLYSTDGTNSHLIDNSVKILTSESVSIGQRDIFPGPGPDGTELYATDGVSLREVADVNPGPLNSSPSSFRVLNGQLLFNGVVGDPSSPGGVLRPYITPMVQRSKRSLRRTVSQQPSISR